LYENDFQDWFIKHARSRYNFNWQEIIMNLRNGRFFFDSISWFNSSDNITREYLSENGAINLGDQINRRLAALASLTPLGEPVTRSLELDGFRVNERTLDLVPLNSIVSEREEEDRVTRLVKQSGLSNEEVILSHVRDARDLFLQGKDHASIGEGRNFVQALIDEIGAVTNAQGGHSIGFPTGTANRLNYLEDVGYFTTDEKAAFGSAWGFLSAGSHPGIPSRDEARIGLILSLEFGVLLLLKLSNWKVNGYKRFS
jgi:hypothetical protein